MYSGDTPVTWWQSVETHAWRAYTTGDTPPAADAVELTLLTDLKGASHQDVGGFHYIVETDVSQNSEEEFNAWYDTEHLPGLARVPGTVSAKRYLRLTGTPRYIACYELVSPAVMESEAWLAIRHTAWSSRIRPMFFNTVRELFVRKP
jgi:hypothetical protein